jgi:hypothetical protein
VADRHEQVEDADAVIESWVEAMPGEPSSPRRAPRSLASAALDQVGANELAIAAPAQVMLGDLGMNARMGRPDLERTVVRHDARPAVVGRRTIADRS